ncbi:TadE/TadG family type IV pilus assembly protein [Sphingomonas sp. AX6]|uniref:TadE/TadG family type IV pilus assembly protein n=1 Tax=Sphingomonas sp. AX6 TaxID=2653171 RepID=UPI0012F46E85|nr:TadE/TadG family type IV pilus assembly protein [Sphingomonas sp. AX6]VXC95285.1 conserved hypothetical protein [Sphingomonas sp. AX6]
MFRLLPRIGRDRSGVTIVEFALVVPVLLAVVMGGFELAYQGYVKAVVQGELMTAGRNSALERAGSDDERFIIDESIRQAILRVAPSARVAPPQRVAFSSYARVRSPAEPDGNNNGICEPGETYEDSNRNGQWDDNSGVANGTGAKDVIVYTVNVEYDRLFPVGALIGMSNTVEISASTNLRIQPYDMQGPVPVRTCS